ncbi:hypothetical protein LEP1GSC013_1712 [Leptospira interrogans serovar Valbuzzi str. Duyster]|uniref:hypothetical protein n=1 Tax=Leptospira interrogans TaxID=173 RepID=UPI0002BA628E|nr:hypothetical protein [Leptospira interrogans]EMJ53926.1 hypothetical protein LEP1GSC013_1712 [Leptospira interrogans serovar Valbuzzi str. Duyster]ENO72220.1 hypothetical protein LEP1GSC012_2514 [Leptospira interrogans serovar Valbuzzi str. Valbuzzi]
MKSEVFQFVFLKKIEINSEYVLTLHKKQISIPFSTNLVFLFTEYTSVKEWIGIQKGTYRNDRSIFQS